jgi:hypothetical protein
VIIVRSEDYLQLRIVSYLIRFGFSLVVKTSSMAYKKAIMARPPMIMATGAELATAAFPVCSTTGGRVVLGVV